MIKYEKLKIEKFNHDTILVQGDRVLYFDPYQIDMMHMPRANVVCISHHHQDHCSPDDLEKVINSQTMLIAAESCRPALGKFQQEKQFIRPGEQIENQGVTISAVPAYNLNKFRAPDQPFHPKEDLGVGFVIEMEGTRIYFAGDTDNIPEMSQLENIDIAFLPVSGTYVMNVDEAVKAAQQIQPKMVIPMHYGSLVGDRKQAEEISQRLEDIKVEILD